MTVVYTKHGPGEIVATDNVRGRRQFKVAGPGWSVWVDETKVNGSIPVTAAYDDKPQPRTHFAERLGWAPVDHDNSVALPYDPEPQYPAIPGDVESTIQPIHEIDPDERLRPADSITFDTRGQSEAGPWPGPSPDLFARSAAYRYADYDDEGEFGGTEGVDDQPPPPDDPMALLQNEPGWQNHTLGELVQEAEALVQMHPDWADRPLGDLVHQVPEMGGQQPPEEEPDFGGEPEDSGEEEPSPEAEAESEEPEESDEGESDEGESEENPFESEDSDESESEDEGEDESDESEVPEECEEYVEKEGQAQLLLALPEIAEALGGGAAAGEAGMGGGGLSGLTKMLPGIGSMMGGGGGGGEQQQTDEQGHPLLPKVDPNNPLPLPDLGAGWGSLVQPKHGSFERPAGLDDKYIDLQAAADHYYDPVIMFRDDPVGYINRTGHVEDEGLNPRFAEYVAQVESDPRIMEAAWKDVRNKALRLRRDGQVHVKDVAPDRIYATVQGDHGVYDTMITKGAAFSGLGGGHAISNWRCSCEWGKWAFRRRYTYVGRLCSHGYAAYMEMQSQHTKGQKRLPRQTKPPKRRRKKADALQMIPQRLVPEMTINDQEDQHLLLDLQKDDRKTTGPGQIMHFSSLMDHCDRTNTPYPRELVAFLVRYAEVTPTTEGDTYPDSTDANAASTAKPAASTSSTGASSTVPGAEKQPGSGDMSALSDANKAAADRTKPDQVSTNEIGTGGKAKTKGEQDQEEADKKADAGTTDPTKNSPDAAGGMGGMGDMMGMMGPAMGAGMDAASALAPAITPMISDALGGALGGGLGGGLGELGGGLASGIGSALSGLSGIFGHKLAASDAYPDPRPNHEPFQGSGPMDPLTIHPSAEHMKDIDYVDVTDLGDYDPSEYKQASRFFEADDLGGGVGNDAGGNTGGIGSPNVAAATPGGLGTVGDVTPSAGGMRDPGSPGGSTGENTRAAYRYADDQTTQDWKVRGTGPARRDLEWLRDQAEDDQSEHFQNMDDYVDEIQEHVQHARDEGGVDASPLVASRGGGIQRAGKPPKRPPVVPTVVREYGPRKQAAQQMIPDIPDPYSKTARDFAEPDVPMGGGGESDIVAQFHRTAGAEAILSESGGGGHEEFDISGAANQFLQRTAGRNYSLAEQAELMNERHPLGARNLDRLDLEGTHYEAENSVGLW